MRHTHFFLGANSAEGFYGLYSELLDAPLRDIGILKGGPGCGKSTLMRRVAAVMEERGEDIVFIHCSGDPDSLDAVIFPTARAALVDGTAPHALEPRYMAAKERYIDFSPCYDMAAAKALAGELTACADAYRAAYGGAYHALRALGGIEAEQRALMRAGFDEKKLLRRAAGIAARELKGRGEGRTARLFLGGLTGKGALERFDSVQTLCPRVYELCDSCALAAPMLRLLHRAALEAGEDALLCPDPLHPALPRHLLLPGRGLAFVTAGRGLAGKPYRRLRIDAMAEETLSRAQKAHLRFLRRLRRELEGEAVDALSRAKAEHDALEALYRSCVDFSRIDALCEAEIGRVSAQLG